MTIAAILGWLAVLSTAAVGVPISAPPSVLVSSNCTDFDPDVRVCDLSTSWSVAQPQGYAKAQYNNSEGFFAQIVMDYAGTDQGLTLKAAADAVLANAQANPDISEFKLLMRGTNTNLLNESEIVVYRAEFQGIPFVFANTIYVGRVKTVQVITWRVTKELENKDREAHLDFGRGLVLMPSF